MRFINGAIIPTINLYNLLHRDLSRIFVCLITHFGVLYRSLSAYRSDSECYADCRLSNHPVWADIQISIWITF
jgi:hypothetical protein